MIRIYGHTMGQGSFTQVTNGFVEAAQAEQLFAGLVPVDADFEDHPGGATAKVAVNCGAPSAVYLPTQIGDHQRRWLMLAPNSDTLPAAMVKWLPPYLTGLLSPSKWGADILRRFFDLPVRVCPHGVGREFSPELVARRATDPAEVEYVLHYRVLHMTSTNAQRKGTRELLDAWKPFSERTPEARLLVVAPREGIAEQHFWVASRGLQASVRVIASGELGRGDVLARRMASFDLVCQPSRAEGFGLVPLEARALGVPVAATSCTGHSEHMLATRERSCPPGCVNIATGDDAPIDDFPGAKAPSLSADAVYDALLLAYGDRWRLVREAREAAREVYDAWSWARQTGPVLRELADG